MNADIRTRTALRIAISELKSDRATFDIPPAATCDDVIGRAERKWPWNRT